MTTEERSSAPTVAGRHASRSSILRRPVPVGVANSVGNRLGYRPGLDGLRAIAVTGVIMAHFWEWILPGGFIGVDMFFVLSGFLITTLLLEEKDRTGRISLRYFYARRALRLLPALGLLLAVLAVWAFLAEPSPLRNSTIKAFPSTIFYYSNWYRGFFGNDVGALGHTWSLSLEEQFYILWPALTLVFLAYRRGLKFLLGACLVGITAAALLRWQLAERNFTEEATRRLIKLRGDILLVGCALAIANVKGWLPQLSRRLVVLVTAGSLAVLGYFGLLIRDGVHDPRFFQGGYTFVALACAVLVYRVVCQPSGVLVRFLSTRPLVFVGRLSYTLYLWHVPMRDIVKPRLGVLPSQLRPFAVLALTIVVSVLSFKLVEQPALRLKDRFTAKGSPPPPPPPPPPSPPPAEDSGAALVPGPVESR